MKRKAIIDKSFGSAVIVLVGMGSVMTMPTAQALSRDVGLLPNQLENRTSFNQHSLTDSTTRALPQMTLAQKATQTSNRGFAHYRQIIETSTSQQGKSERSKALEPNNETTTREDTYHLNHVTGASKLLQRKQADEVPPTPQNRYIFLNGHTPKPSGTTTTSHFSFKLRWRY